MMHLGYVQAPDCATPDGLLAVVAAGVMARGLRVAGAVQHNRVGAGRDCEGRHGAGRHGAGHARGEMWLQILGGDLAGTREIVISQRLGAGARGCRLDPGALEAAVVVVERSLHHDTQILILNKFGRQEALGRGFVPLIAEALGRDIPVVLGVSQRNMPEFQVFEGGMAQALPYDAGAVGRWCRAAVARRRM